MMTRKIAFGGSSSLPPNFASSTANSRRSLSDEDLRNVMCKNAAVSIKLFIFLSRKAFLVYILNLNLFCSWKLLKTQKGCS